MKVKRKFPVVLLCFTLVLALLVSALVTPGFALPLFFPDNGEREVQRAAARFDQSVRLDANGCYVPAGHSKAFSIEPVQGFTISAEKNALDRDRTFTMTEVSPEDYEALVSSAEQHIGLNESLLGAWELDAGLADNEILPGTFRVDCDLSTLGVQPQDYQYVRAYRIDDSGVWHPYVHKIENGILSLESRQNCFLSLSISWVSLAKLSAVAVPVSMYMIDQFAAGGYSIESLHTQIPVEIDGAVRYTIVCDLPEQARKLKEAGLTTLIHQLKQQAEENVKQRFIAQYNPDCDLPLTKVSPKLIFSWLPPEKQATFDWKAEIKSEFDKLRAASAEFARQEQVVKEIEKMTEEEFKTKEPQIQGLIRALTASYHYLIAEQCVFPTDPISVHFTTGKDTGVTYDPFFGAPYMVVSDEEINKGTQKAYDDMLLTVLHENYHICQRTLVSDLYSCYRFDEMTAQGIEYEAAGFFFSDPDERCPNYHTRECFAAGMNRMSMTYPEGTYTAKDNATASYGLASFIVWLRKNVPNAPSYGKILTLTKDSSQLNPSELIRIAFGLSEKELTQYFLQYTEAEQTRFYDRALRQPATLYTPQHTVSEDRLEIPLINNNYTVRARKLEIQRRDPIDQKYCAALIPAENFGRIMKDFSLLPLHMTQGSDYQFYSLGRSSMNKAIYFSERSYDDGPLWILESDGGTGIGTSSYTVAVLREPQMPVTLLEDGKLTIRFPKLSSTNDDAPSGILSWFYSKKPEILWGYQYTLRLDDRVVLSEYVSREKAEKPFEVDFNGDYASLGVTAGELSNMTITIREVLEHTMSSTPLMGPESPEMPLGIDILGDWKISTKVEQFGMQWADGLVNMMPEELEDYKKVYGQIMGEVEGSESVGIMTIARTEQGAIEASVVYENNPETTLRYHCQWDAKRMALVLAPVDSGQDISPPFSLYLSMDQARHLSFEGEIATDSVILTFKAVMRGTKLDPAASDAE